MENRKLDKSGKPVYYYLSDGVVIEKLLWWQEQGLTKTATGYGTKIPTTKMVSFNSSRFKRVYCDIYSNSGFCYIIENKLIVGVI